MEDVPTTQHIPNSPFLTHAVDDSRPFDQQHIVSMLNLQGNFIGRPPSPTLVDVEAKEDGTDVVDGTSLYANPNNMDPSSSHLLDQLAENEISINGPSELDFFTSRASISPSKQPVLKAQESAETGTGDEVDELLREWTTVLG
jgi:hypothetical protein